MEYRETIVLKDGRACVIRQGTAADGEGVLRNFVLNHAWRRWTGSSWARRASDPWAGRTR